MADRGIMKKTETGKKESKKRNGEENGSKNASEKRTKLTKLEKYWILYDVGNSAFTLLVATILPIYFNSLTMAAGVSEVDSLAYWGYAASISTLIVACIGPVLGTMADTKGWKRPIFTVAVAVGAAGLAALSFHIPWNLFLLVFVIAKVGYSSSLIFYDAMLSDVTEPEKMDQVSSYGYAWGYIGSCIPFLVSLGLILGYESIGISLSAAMGISLWVNAGWWILMTIPLWMQYHQKYYVEKREHVVRESFERLFSSLKEIRRYRKIFWFLLAFFFYIDGVYTIIDMATAYGSSLGLQTEGLLLALLLTQVVAFPCALIFARLAKQYPTDRLIQICILAYTAIAVFAIQLDKQWEFWVLAFFVGMFQGAVQALSRSYFAKIIPPNKSGEFFGIFDICGKGAAFLGTALVGLIAQITGSPNLGVAVLAVMFVVGYLIFRKAAAMEEAK